MDEARILDGFNGIRKEMANMSSKLDTVTRMEERLKNHAEKLEHQHTRLNNHSDRVSKSELWQAEHGNDCASADKLKDVEKKVETLETIKDKETGTFSVIKELAKWVAAVGAFILGNKLVG